MLGNSPSLRPPHPVDWIDEYTIHSYESDAKGKASLPAVCRFLQETAWHHANSMGLGFKHLSEQGAFWVLSRLSIRVFRYPGWGETVRVRTWASGLDRLFALRDFTVTDERGDPVGAAASAWLVLGEESRRPKRPGGLFEGTVLLRDVRALENGPEKVPALNAPLKGASFAVRYSDLDVQNHVNNARLIEWVLDGFSDETHRTRRAVSFSINFLAECAYGDRVTLSTEQVRGEPDGGDGDARLASMLRESDGKEICRAKVVFLRE